MKHWIKIDSIFVLSERNNVTQRSAHGHMWLLRFSHSKTSRAPRPPSEKESLHVVFVLDDTNVGRRDAIAAACGPLLIRTAPDRILRIGYALDREMLEAVDCRLA
jgi:hypothetical protein